MKKINILLISLLVIGFSSCKLFNARKGNSVVIEDGKAIGYDILYNEAIDSINSLTGKLELYKDSIITLNNKLNYLNSSYSSLQDSILIYKEDAFVYKYKIERIKAYDKIVRNNSSQSKYFLGWVRRVLED